MTSLQEAVDAQVAADVVPGAVALVAQGDDVTVAWAGDQSEGGPPMARDSLFRIASLTKPIVAAATMALVDRGTVDLDDPVSQWLPELAEPAVLRQADGPVDDVVPAMRPITVRHLLTFQGGHGFPTDFSLPVVARLVEDLGQGAPQPQAVVPPDEWMARLGEIPLLHQPGEGWTYNAGADILGVLLARAEGAPLGEVLADTVLDPLGMTDTHFAAPEGDRARMTSYHRRGDDGGFDLVDPPDGQWASAPAFPSGAGGLVASADDWLVFGRMLLAGGEHRGQQVLSSASVGLMMTSHVEAEPDHLILQGQGWGFGGSVDVAPLEPWSVLGRYGWVGGTGTAAHVIPSRNAVVVWMSQVELGGPDDSKAMAAVLTWAAEHTGA